MLAELSDGSGAQYGVDAPGVVIGLVAGGLAGMTITLATRHFVAWPIMFHVVGILAVAAAVPLLLGLSMIVYAIRGKHRLRDWMLDRHQWRGDEVVVDIGSGRGLMAVGAAHRVPNGKVYAVDIWRAGDLSKNGAEGLLANARLEGVEDRIEVLNEDARAVGLPSASVDIIVSVLCFHNIEPLPERERALAEIVRLLKPGGRSIIADYIATGSYARYFQAVGLSVEGPIHVEHIALTSVTVVDVTKRMT